MALRCAPHGLAVGPDGRCVLCRREAGMGSAPEAPPTPESVPTIRVPASSLIFVALAVAIGVGYAFLRRTDAAPSATETARALVPTREANAAERGGSPPRAGPDSTRTERSVPEPRELPEREQPLPARVVEEREARQAPTTGVVTPQKDAPGAEELRAALRTVRITMYTTQWCPHCTRARNWLRANNIAYNELDVETSESARRDRDRINPRGGVPTVDIDGEVLVGFGEASWSRAIARATQRKLELRRR